MKQLFAFVTAIVAAFMISATIPAAATQSAQKDSIVIIGDSTTIFKGKQATTTADSLKAVKSAIADSTINSLIGSAITAIENRPTSGGAAAWIGWGIAALLSAIVGIVQVRKRLINKPPDAKK